MVQIPRITIENAVIENHGRRVTNQLKIPGILKPFFKGNVFYVEYDHNISDVPLGILNIPALSSIIHFAWAAGCNVDVGEIDETHLRGLRKAKSIFVGNPGYKSLDFGGFVNVAKTTTNTFEKQNRDALLFSGGLDSTASQIHRKPERLIMIWGLDTSTSWVSRGGSMGFWDRIVKTYRHLPLTLIKSNTLELYDLSHLFALGEAIPAGYYAAVAHSIITFGLCPPTTVGDVDSVMMASSYPTRHHENPDYPYQSYKALHTVDNYFGWGNIKTLDVETEYNRPEKIEHIIKPHFDENGPSVIRVCGHKAYLKTRQDKSKLNCGICDKCCRAIAHLSNYGIDPAECGFPVHGKTFAQIRNNLVSKRYNWGREKHFWGELKKHIKEDTPYDFHGSKAFLEWLNGYEL